MPHMSEMMSEMIKGTMMTSEMMTDMYMDITIKEHNDPSPSAFQEQKASKATVCPTCHLHKPLKRLLNDIAAPRLSEKSSSPGVPARGRDQEGGHGEGFERDDAHCCGFGM